MIIPRWDMHIKRDMRYVVMKRSDNSIMEAAMAQLRKSNGDFEERTIEVSEKGRWKCERRERLCWIRRRKRIDQHIGRKARSRRKKHRRREKARRRTQIPKKHRYYWKMMLPYELEVGSTVFRP